MNTQTALRGGSTASDKMLTRISRLFFFLSVILGNMRARAICARLNLQLVVVEMGAVAFVLLVAE